MRLVNIVGLTAAGLIVFSINNTSLAAPDCTDPKHADKPVCSGGDGGDGDGAGDIATNDITARWDGAVDGTGTSPRDCTQEGKPHPSGTHIPYSCVQDQFHTISVSLTGGWVVDSTGSPTAEDEAICSAGFSFAGVYPNAQYIVSPTSGEVCTDGGCQLTVLNVIRNQRSVTGYDSVKLTGVGWIPESTTLNPFACPEAGSPVTATYDIDTVDVGVRNGKGSKADLACRFDTSSGTNLTQYQVTPVCP